jgi:hypothetical protein
MARVHGITSDTYQNFLIDAGAVYKNRGESDEELLGATRGGSTFTIETEYRNMEVDGAKGPLLGAKRIINVQASMVVNFIEWTPALMALALAGSDIEDEGSPKTHDKITRAFQIAAGDYFTNLTLVVESARSATGLAEFKLTDVMADGNFEVPVTENEEPVLAITFRGHFDPSALDAEPWEILIPVAD